MKRHTIITLAFVLSFLLILILATTAGATNQYQGDQIAHGKYIVSIAGCADCHTPLKAEFMDPTQWTADQVKTVAFNAGLAIRHVQKVEAGEVNLTLETLRKLAEGLGVDPSVLLAP